MIFVAVGVISVITVAMFSCCAAAGRADDWEEQWLREHDREK